MCDTKKQLSIDTTGGEAAHGICDSASDTISLSSDICSDKIDKAILQQSLEQQQLQNEQKLQQTTQSLMMASAMLVGSSSNIVGVNNNSSSNLNLNNNNNDGDTLNSQHQGHYSSSNIFGSTDSMNAPVMTSLNQPTSTTLSHNRSAMGQIVNSPSNYKLMHINVHELLMENQALREKLKEVTVDRDRLLCEVSNLRLELDMFELKRLPEEK